MDCQGERANVPNERALVETLMAYFGDAGARVESVERFRAQYGLDFSVTRFERLDAHVNLGVHLTDTFDHVESMERFAHVVRRGIALKALYIELHPETAQGGGLLVALGAALTFLFERRHTGTRVMGLRIEEDCTFQFFELEEALERIARADFDGDLQIGEALKGRIIAYFSEKGFGFVQSDDERKMFFHVANIADDVLRARLPAYLPGEVIPVEFQYGGHDGKKYPKAINLTSPAPVEPG